MNGEIRKSFAIRAKKLTVSYEITNRVLDELSFNIPTGCIYGLIGPSGCGKTTLLRCVIGLKKADSGIVQLFGGIKRKCHQIGYMPQESFLYSDLTIHQTIVYFGTLNQLPLSYIKLKSQHLLSLFNLPQSDRLIGQLSTGQQRRVSLICAILHQPNLIILDEPTVGCDPIVREAILTYLIKLCSQKVTIIITTHYVEEARRCHVVGFMRKGQILLETEPNNIIKSLGVNSLEEVFIQLCLKNGSTILEQNENGRVFNQHDSRICNGHDEKIQRPSTDVIHRVHITLPLDYKRQIFRYIHMIITYMSIIMVLIRRMMSQMKHKRISLAAYLVCNVVLAGLWTSCNGRMPKNLKLGLIDGEVEDNDGRQHGSTYMAILGHSGQGLVNFIHFNSTEYANWYMRHDINLHGFLEIPRNFTNNFIQHHTQLMEEFESGEDEFLFLHDDEEEEEFQPMPRLKYIPSGLNPIQAKMIKFFLPKILSESMKEILSNQTRPDRRPSLEFQWPFSIISLGTDEQFKPENLTTDMFNWKRYYIPSTVIFCSHLATLMYFAIAFHPECTPISMERNSVHGIDASQILIASIIVSIIVPITISFPLLLIPFGLHHVAIAPITVPAILVILMVNQIASLLTSFLFATIQADISTIIMIINGYMFAGEAVTGFLTSYQSIPYFIKYLRYFYPYPGPHDAMIDIMMREHSAYTSSKVGYCLLQSFSFILIVFTLTLFHMKRLNVK